MARYTPGVKGQEREKPKDEDYHQMVMSSPSFVKEAFRKVEQMSFGKSIETARCITERVAAHGPFDPMTASQEDLAIYDRIHRRVVQIYRVPVPDDVDLS